MVGFSDHAPHSLNHLVGAMGIGSDVLKCGASLVKVRRRPVQPSKPGTGVRYDGRERLLDLMRYCSRHRRKHRALGNLGKFFTGFLQSVLSNLKISDVASHGVDSFVIWGGLP